MIHAMNGQEGGMWFYRGGQRVRKGEYWNLMDGSLVDVTGEDEMLPGRRGLWYMRRPPGGPWVIVPACVVLYVLTLPLTSTFGYLVAWFFPAALVLGGALYVMFRILSGLFDAASIGWRPFEAFFKGRKDDDDKK